MSSSDQTINIPQLILILVLGGLAIRYFFFSSSTNSGSQGRSAINNLRAREADVERVQQMFPQVSRRSIMWDLQRNGGNVVATTERILSGRGLEVVSLSLHASFLSNPHLCHL
jgi:coupling of ubiquitin conjugation to ER degradation protein 1